MKKIFLALLLFIGLKATAQSPVPAQEAGLFVGKVMCTYGYVFKTERDGKAMLITFGSKYDNKGIFLKLSDEMKLAPEANFEDLKGRFMTVTGTIVKDKKGRTLIDGDDPSTSIMIKEALAVN